MSVRDRARAALTRLVNASPMERILISTSALVLSILIGAVLILVAGRMTSCSTSAYTLAFPGPLLDPITGFLVPSDVPPNAGCYDPIDVYDLLFLGAFGNILGNPTNGQFATTLAETTILILTGLSVAVAFKAGIFNIGSQGQLVVGALVTAVVFIFLAPPFAGLGIVGTLVLLLLGVSLGAVAGGLYGALPGALKAYADANEVITTIMLNFVATAVALYVAQDIVPDPDTFATQTVTLPDFAMFPAVFFAGRDDFSILALAAAITLVVAVFFLLARTAFGYDIRTSGLQPGAAEYGGVDSKRTIVASMTLSGALAGIGGAIYVLMVLGNYQTGIPSYGFDGITVSILAGNNPLGVAFAALLFGVLKSGSIVVQVGSDVPPELVGVLRGFIILFVAMPEFFRMLGHRLVPLDEREDRGAVATDGGGDADG